MANSKSHRFVSRYVGHIYFNISGQTLRDPVLLTKEDSDLCLGAFGFATTNTSFSSFQFIPSIIAMKLLMLHTPAQKLNLKREAFRPTGSLFSLIQSTTNEKQEIQSLLNSSGFVYWKNSLSFQMVSVPCSLLQMPIPEGCV